MAVIAPAQVMVDLRDLAHASACEMSHSGRHDNLAQVVCEEFDQDLFRISADAAFSGVRGASAAAVRVFSEAEHVLAASSPDYVVIHAGVVALGSEVLILPGRSHAGKSTAVVSLLRAGAIYYSDDYALVGPDGSVSPYPRPIRLREIGRSVGVLPPNAVVASEPAPPRLVVFSEFAGDATQFVPVRLSPADGLLRLLDHCLQARSDPRRTLDALEAVANQVTFYAGDRGDSATFAGEVERLMAETTDSIS